MDQKLMTKLGKIIAASVAAVGLTVLTTVNSPKPTVKEMGQPTQQSINYRSNQLLVCFWHCSANTAGSKMTAKDIERFHCGPREKGGNGWKRPGYNDVFETSGKHVVLVPYNDDDIVQFSERANGAGEFNGIARHICYIGGIDKKGKAKNTLNAAQDTAIKHYYLDLVKKHPNILIVGHNQVQKKPCPSFNVPQKLRSYGIPDKNIWWWNNWYPEEKIPNEAQGLVKTLVVQPD